MITNDVLPTEVLRQGEYLCLRIARRAALAALPVDALAERLGLVNEFFAPAPEGRGTVAFLRRLGGQPGDLADPDVMEADAVVHVSSTDAAVVAEFTGEARKLIGDAARTKVIGGVIRPMSYTGTAMHNFAYAHRVQQTSGTLAPNAFLVPMSKTADWWRKDWMERHTYFLPRYDEQGRMTAEGHALASAAGIEFLLRRTYKARSEPAPEGAYDFVTYFECDDAHVSGFHEVCAALRDRKRNPEWAFVREGPTWHGRRVPTWSEAVA